jgi:hypothetical protein
MRRRNSPGSRARRAQGSQDDGYGSEEGGQGGEPAAPPHGLGVPEALATSATVPPPPGQAGGPGEGGRGAPRLPPWPPSTLGTDGPQRPGGTGEARYHGAGQGGEARGALATAAAAASLAGLAGAGSASDGRLPVGGCEGPSGPLCFLCGKPPTNTNPVRVRAPMHAHGRLLGQGRGRGGPRAWCCPWGLPPPSWRLGSFGVGGACFFLFVCLGVGGFASGGSAVGTRAPTQPASPAPVLVPCSAPRYPHSMCSFRGVCGGWGVGRPGGYRL